MSARPNLESGRPPLVGMSLLVALVGGMAATVAANAGLKTGASIVVGVIGLCCLVVFRSKRVLVAGLLLLIPFSLDVNLFYRDNGGSVGGLVISAADICTWLLATKVLLDRFRLGRPVVWDFRFLAPALAICAAGVLSFTGSDHLTLGLFELFRLAKAALLMVVIANVVESEDDVKLVVVFLFIGLIAQSILVGLQWYKGGTLGLGIFGENTYIMTQKYGASVYRRASGTLLHPNMLANYLNFILFIAIGMLLVLRPGPFFCFAGLTSVAGVAALLVSMSRGGWVAFVAGSLVLLVLLWAKFPQRRLMLLVLAVTSVVGLAAAVILPTPIHERLFSYDYRAAYLRIPLAVIALKITALSPFTGVGLNSYPQVVRPFLVNAAPDLLPPWYFLDNLVVHNLFLLVAAETGLFGLAAFLWFMGAILFAGWRLARTEPVTWLNLVALGILAGVCAFLVAELFDNSYRVGSALIYQTYLFAGLLAAMERLRMEQREETAGAVADRGSSLVSAGIRPSAATGDR